MSEEIYKRIWELSPHVKNKEVYQLLVSLTKQLITVYEKEGQLNENPFNPTTERNLSLDFDKVNNTLKNCICLVTGGVGCVGTQLVTELLNFDVKLIVVIDIAITEVSSKDKVVYLHGDVCDFQFLQQVFNQYKPGFVFHTAAQRDPGYAEIDALRTYRTNVLGTLNVIKACELSNSVKQFVFTSTGKASRYYTNEVYAATKKICEYVIDTYSKASRIKYSMARFTHVFDNSLMNIELEEASKNNDHVAVHSPGKYVTAQNIKEAACLLLNAITYAGEKECNFLIVRYLAWPVESLEVALYYIKASKRDIPVIFKGNPPGYTEKFFRGQMNWSNPTDMNLLINVYEYKDMHPNEDEDILISHIVPVDKNILENALETLSQAKNDNEIKSLLAQELKAIVKSQLKNVDNQETLKILKWGLQREYLNMEKTKASTYAEVPLLLESLENSAYYDEAKAVVSNAE